MQAVLVEMRVPLSSERGFALEASAALEVPGFQVDSDFEPIPVQATEDGARSLAAASEELVLVRGTVDPSQIPDLEAQPNVEKVWLDTPIAPFGAMPMEMADTELMAPAEAFGNMPMEVVETAVVAPMEAFATCPIGTCDCSPSTPRGNMADVANYLGVDDIWAGGHRGDGIVVGVVDGGITAQGRPISSADTSHTLWPNKLVPRVIGGWPTSNWGTTGVSWKWHGNMTSTDVLGMAPNAKIYDLRIASSSMAGTISNALSAFQWAINQHAANGTPQILSNSWGIFQEAWDPTYARNANHPFTRKVIEAINAGILVLFAAGNCGGTCPDSRCGSDSGPGKSIWGANSHPAVITVGAVNKNEQFVGYSSQGPGALDPNKPDFCSVTHFTGFFNSDSGTSAATPIAAGVLALMKQAKPSLTQAEAKTAFKNTAKDIGPAGFDQHSGSGILRAKKAFDAIQPHVWKGWENLGGFCTNGVAVSSWAANRLDCFVIGNNRSMWHKWWNGSAWHGWENLGGQCYSAPAAVSWGPNRIDTFVIGGNHAMYHKWWNGSSWHGWENLGGFCTDGVAVSSWAANRLDCFVIGNNRALYHKWWDGSSWHGWENLGGQCYSAPAAVSWGPNRIDVFVIGGNRAMYHKWWNGSSWHGWENLGGFCTDGVAVSSWAANRLDCFVIGNNRSMYHKWWNGSSWHGWENLGGQCYSAPAAVSWGPSRIDTFVIGGNRAMYHKWYG
jgi:subtilisin family serine protease